MAIRLHFHPDSPPGTGPPPEPASTVTGPPPDSSSGDLGSFSPYEEPVSHQPGAAAPASGSVSPGGSGSQPLRPAPSGAAGDPNAQAIQAGQSGAAVANEWQSVREAAAQRFGYEVPQGVDTDEAFLAHLVRQAQANRQADVYAQVGRQIAPHLQDFQQFQQQRAAQTTAAPDYAPPPFDERWMALVDRDPATGVFYARQGAPTGIAEAVNKYAQWQSDFQKNPIAVLDRYAESKLAPMVQSQIQQHLAQFQQQNQVSQILAQNDSWLYQRNPAGQYVTGPQGRVLTPEGTAYGQQIRALQQAGVTDPQAQDLLARQLVAGQMAIGRINQNTQNTNPAAQIQANQQAARTNVNAAQARGSLERATVPGAMEPNSEGLSLAEMLRTAFDQNGYTDQRFQQEFNN